MNGVEIYSSWHRLVLYTVYGVNYYFVVNTTERCVEVKALVHWCSYDIFLFMVSYGARFPLSYLILALVCFIPDLARAL